ncbi:MULTISPECIES: HPr family phosphocarrier protein [Curvivirga]|uniref:HPr family phosphocarrier protein n=1 Tax=Curvivirga TaxID=2856846 RepID=UPI0012BCCEFD|nr:HPr family phosphocarrier protein [Curvivirga aplysinae]MTI09340.1 HPr family phosphocarrier protein [Curvivirga aplysinae]
MSDTAFEKTLEIVNKRGLHARAAAKFSKLSDEFDADIRVSKDGQTVSGLSIMGLMMLSASKGTTIEIATSGAQAEDAMKALEELVSGAFDEEE